MMRSLFYAIVQCEQAYLNERELSGGVRIVTNTTVESVSHLNRIGKVLTAPEDTVLEEGMEVIMHHNIVRKRNDTAGERIDSDYALGRNQYYVPLDLIFAYRHPGEEWEALAPYCFLRPIENEEKVTPAGIILPPMEKYVNQEAEAWILNKELREWGVEKGDIVGYGENQEYEFEIDGQTLYRVRMPKLLYKRCKD